MLKPTLREVIRSVAPDGRAALIALLGRNIASPNVSQWLSGRRRVPPWAVDRMRARLQAMDAVLVASKSGDRSVLLSRHWRAYHARRARERDEQAKKEKGEI